MTELALGDGTKMTEAGPCDSASIEAVRCRMIGDFRTSDPFDAKVGGRIPGEAAPGHDRG